MDNNNYAPLPTEPPAQLDVEHEEEDTKPRPPRQASGPTVLQTTDPRFNPPSPSPLKRAALLLFVFCLFWFALRLRTAKLPRPLPSSETERYMLVHPTNHVLQLTLPRYSTDFDYRPAVNRERMKHTKTKFRGA